MVPQWLWKLLQLAVFGGLTVFFFEASDREFPMLAALIIALGLTAVIFAPFLHLEQWLLRRREKTRGHKRLN